jgi:hypothetical protein
MKQLSKMMLAAVASVALAAPAFAWDFNASGTAAAYLNSTSTKASTSATNTVASGGVSSEGSSLKLASSHTDGSKTLSLSYTLDWDGNLDETVSLSGSSTVGAWTASGNVAYNLDTVGCYGADNGTSSTAQVTSCGTVGDDQAGEDTTNVSLTDGTMTITLGDASHLSSQNVSSNGAAAGAVSFDSADDDASVGAFVGSFHGVSLGYKISDTMSATVAYQKSADTADVLGAGESYDSEGTTYGTTGTGLGFSGTFGPATVGVTVASASTADVGSATADPASNSTATSTTGLGVKLDLGDIDPFFSYGSYTALGSVSQTGVAYGGTELGLVYALGDDGITFYYGSYEETATTAGVAGETLKKTGMELGYNTAVGPAGLNVGYGSQNWAQTDGTYDGYSMTDIEVALTYSF